MQLGMIGHGRMGRNSNDSEDVRRAKALKGKGIRYTHVGPSGVRGLVRGY